MKLGLIIAGVLIVLPLAGIVFYVFVVENVETPDYRVVRQDGPYEVRDYPPLIVAESRHQGERREALSAGFRALAAYIFASDRAGGKIAMTAPVTQERGAKIAMTAPVTQAQEPGGVWVVRFIMPAQYELGELPAPGSEGVTLGETPARRTAAKRFSGTASNEVVAEQEAALRAWMQERGLRAAGSARYAYYNGPLTPPFLRRYEILIDVQDRQEPAAR